MKRKRQMEKIVLASASPRRKELMRKITPAFTILVAEGEESALGATPKETAILRAREKALWVASRIPDTHTVIGCDTVVALGLQLFGKPENAEDAVNMLTALQGTAHRVYTGVCITCKGQEYLAAGETEVVFHSLTEQQIREYVSKYKPLDKAGAYGIQDGFPLVKTIVGSYDNVVGFPTELVSEMLKGAGVL